MPMAAPPKAEDIDFNRTNATELETMNVTEIKRLCKMHGLSAVGESSGRWNPCLRWGCQASCNLVDDGTACTPDGKYSGFRFWHDYWLCRRWPSQVPARPPAKSIATCAASSWWQHLCLRLATASVTFGGSARVPASGLSGAGVKSQLINRLLHRRSTIGQAERYTRTATDFVRYRLPELREKVRQRGLDPTGVHIITQQRQGFQA